MIDLGRLALAFVFPMTMLAGPARGAEAPDLSGIYWTTQYNSKIQLIGGAELPFTAAGKAAYAKNIAGLRNGTMEDEARRWCVPDGPVRALANPYPFEIVQAPPGNVTLLFELSHMVRAIRLHKPMPANDELMTFPSYNGYSIGRYEDDTLVVETKGFNEKTFLDATGAPHTDELKTIERIRKLNPTELEIVITVRDPQFYSKEWDTRFMYNLRNDLRIEDYVCGEPHRDISSVRGVRRP